MLAPEAFHIFIHGIYYTDLVLNQVIKLKIIWGTDL